MVIREPNSLPDDVKPKPHDANSAATVLNDVQMTEMPRGGGGRCQCRGWGKLSDGATLHSPIDVTVPHGGGGNPTSEAQLRSLNDGPDEPHSNLD
jgi:hypothetical protein